MASKRDIIIIALVVVIFSVPICAATQEEFKASFIRLIGAKIPDLNSTQWAEAFWHIGVDDTTQIQDVKDDLLSGAPTLTNMLPFKRSQVLGKIQEALRAPTLHVADSKLRQAIKDLIGDIDGSHMMGTNSSQLLDAFVNTGIESLDQIAVVDKNDLIPGLRGVNPLTISLLLKDMKDALTQKKSENYPCKSSPCQNEGTCNKTDNGHYSCQCPPAYTGEYCESKFDPCKNTCQNGGNCTTKENGQYLCQCPAAYIGENCETNKILKERLIFAIECAKSNMDENGKQINATKMQERADVDGVHSVEELGLLSVNDLKTYCPNLEGKFTYAKFAKALAKVADSDKAEPVCSSNPCLNDGTCEDEVCSYICQCVQGYTGVTCESKVADKKMDTKTNATGKGKQDTDTTKKPETKEPGLTRSGNSELFICLACGAVFVLIGGLGYYYRQKIKSLFGNDIPYTKVNQDEDKHEHKKKKKKDPHFIY